MTSVMDDGRVEFVFYRRDAKDVRVIGDLAHLPGGLAMHSTGDGWWKAVAFPGAGEFRFHYEADGQRFVDYASHGVEVGKQGFTSILYVPQNQSLRAA